MEAKDYEKNIEIYEAELERLQEALTDEEPGTDEYSRIADSIRKLNEAKLTEHRCASEKEEAEKKRRDSELVEERRNSEKREHIVPDWCPKLLSVLVTGGLGVMIYRGEMAGKVVGSTAVSMLNKLRF